LFCVQLTSHIHYQHKSSRLSDDAGRGIDPAHAQNGRRQVRAQVTLSERAEVAADKSLWPRQTSVRAVIAAVPQYLNHPTACRRYPESRPEFSAVCTQENEKRTPHRSKSGQRKDAQQRWANRDLNAIVLDYFFQHNERKNKGAVKNTD